jgi:hypothetical protein
MSNPEAPHRAITRYEDLPPDLKRVVDTHPPELRVKEACALRKRSRAYLYEGIKEGRYHAVKDGSTTLINTLSLVLDIANLPPAKMAPVPHLVGRRRKPASTPAPNPVTEQMPPEPRHGDRVDKPIAAPPSEREHAQA